MPSEPSELSQILEQLNKLQIDQERLRNRERSLLRRARELEQVARQVDQTTGPLQVGDRVLITNRITHVTRGRTATPADRLATVTRVHRNQVHVKTDNGHHTWRVANNLRKQG